MNKRKSKRQLLPRPYNAGTMTVAEFWSMIRSALRKSSRWWKPIQQVKAAVKRKYTGPNKRQKFEYQCNVCKNYFPEKRINVDHIIPVGSLMCSDDLKGFVERLFCEKENLQVMCDTCHDKKTKQEKKDRYNKNNQNGKRRTKKGSVLHRQTSSKLQETGGTQPVNDSSV